MSVKNQISIINDEVKDKAELVVVSKTRSLEQIIEAYDQGHKKFGENRVQEIVEKYNNLPKDIEWHMIGHLQKNKVKHISKFISLIHSLDRLSLAKEIDKNARKDNRSINCLIQIKISKDETKYGLNPKELDSFYRELKEFKNLNIVGLMAMATFTKDQILIAEEFKEMKNLFLKMKSINSSFKILSIGMSDDYLIAINNGSNMIRVGSKIFGKRNY
ncbi:MAG: YggS family pyridoxal phosphate-dependent enzyme [Flavobacteriaceae bacterium]|nr:YggS family pyridoxal phosphate-dependent enzyme [Flavobacteriaceae bacterium]MDG2500740.1 YggS family pyridoxal phosphate-dependent enzyme [Flavobacteriaceae bacterium]|tara:strand:+ start:2061 stop:2711 length:651 start_codon:yes stop_codon:yes gene_type:complete